MNIQNSYKKQNPTLYGEFNATTSRLEQELLRVQTPTVIHRLAHKHTLFVLILIHLQSILPTQTAATPLQFCKVLKTIE